MARDDKVTTIRRDYSIAWTWQYFGFPGKAERQCCSPFHEDKNPSFSVWHTPEGDKWKDHSTGEAGDVIDFWAKAKGIPIGQAIIELHSFRNCAIPPVPYKPTPKPNGIIFRQPNMEECIRIGKLRGLDPAAFHLAGTLGTLKIGNHPVTNEPLWWLTDLNGHASEGRTFDGNPCQATGKKVAALPGSRKDFPVGMKTTNREFDRLSRIMLVEGSSDYYAGLHMAMRIGINFRVASMLGAGCNICEAAVPLFDQTNVLILAHNDDNGQTAAYRWKEQLTRAKSTYVTVQPLPEGIKDLNDLMLCPIFSFNPLSI